MWSPCARGLRAGFLGLLALVAASQAAFGQPAENLNLTHDQWRQDLHFLAEELPKRHANAFHTTPKAQFDAAVADLDGRLAGLDADQTWVGMEEIVSLIGDAHTTIRFPSDCADLPIVIGRFDGDYRVTRVGPGLERALGAKVLKIDDTPVETARALLRPLTPLDVYENRADAVTAIDFTIGCALHGAGITKDRNLAHYALETDAGERFVVEVKATAPGEAAKVKWVWPFAQPPLFRQNPDLAFWYVPVPKARAVYVSIRATRGLRAASEALMKFLAQQAPDRLIIDLRQNPGGDYFEGLNNLIKPIAANPALNRKGHLFVLIGPLTFSAAMANAAQFHAMTQATLVGEPIGARPNEYSEPRSFTLPNSRLTVRYSTTFYEFVESGENVVKPDVEVATSWADFKAGRDPVLEWALRQ